MKHFEFQPAAGAQSQPRLVIYNLAWNAGTNTLTFYVAGADCWQLQLSYDGVTWYPAGDGRGAGQIEITPRDQGGTQYFRVVETECPPPQ